jgi:hypothetical protein
MERANTETNLPWLRYLACAALISASSLPTLRRDYLFSDDYYWYDIQHTRPAAAAWEATMMAVMNGRPVHGLLFIASFPLLAERATWLVLRVLGVALLGLTAWVLSRALRRLWPEPTADWIATAAVALPGFALFSFWLIGMPCLLAAVCGAWAFVLALDAIEHERNARSARWRMVGAAAVLMLGLANYQPFALSYFSLLGLFAAFGQISFALFALGVASVGIYFVLARLCILAFHFDVAQRGELTFAPLAKVRWFLESALPFASKLWWIALPTAAAAVAMVLFAGWALRETRRRSEQGLRAWAVTVLVRGLFIAACGLMTALPHLAVRETVTRFRTLLPLSLLFALLVAAAVVEFCHPRVRALLPVLVACLFVSRGIDLHYLGVLPERALVLQAATALRQARTDAPDLSSIYVVRAGAEDHACATRLSDDEFTAPSSQHDFAIGGIVRLASVLSQLPVPRVTQGTVPTSASAVAKIDLRQVDAITCSRARTWLPRAESAFATLAPPTL